MACCLAHIHAAQQPACQVPHVEPFTAMTKGPDPLQSLPTILGLWAVITKMLNY